MWEYQTEGLIYVQFYPSKRTGRIGEETMVEHYPNFSERNKCIDLRSSANWGSMNISFYLVEVLSSSSPM